jgi:hypothetical protein
VAGPRTPARLPEWPVFVADLRADKVEPSIVAEWWKEKGGDLPGLLLAYANPPLRDLCDVRPYVPHTPGNFDCLHCHPRYDDSLRPLLAAWHAAARPGSPSAAVRGLEVVATGGLPGRPGDVRPWAVRQENGTRHEWLSWHDTEPAARAALVHAVLALHDDDEVPCGACGGKGWNPAGLLGTDCFACAGKGRVPLRVPCPGCGGEKFVPTPSGVYRMVCKPCRGAGAVPPSGLVETQTAVTAGG